MHRTHVFKVKIKPAHTQTVIQLIHIGVLALLRELKTLQTFIQYLTLGMKLLTHTLMCLRRKSLNEHMAVTSQIQFTSAHYLC